MLGPARQAYAYGDIKMELRLPIYVLWIAALASLAGTIFCALVCWSPSRRPPIPGATE